MGPMPVPYAPKGSRFGILMPGILRFPSSKCRRAKTIMLIVIVKERGEGTSPRPLRRINYGAISKFNCLRYSVPPEWFTNICAGAL